MDDFYVILPSNSCGDIHPDNAANKYFVSWQTPIDLNGQWKVALTEANFNYIKSTISTEFAIEYEVASLHTLEVESKLTFQTNVNTGEKFNARFPVNAVTTKLDIQMPGNEPYKWKKPVVHLQTNNYLSISCDDYFEIKFQSLEEAQLCGFDRQTEYCGGDFSMLSDNPVPIREIPPRPEQPTDNTLPDHWDKLVAFNAWADQANELSRIHIPKLTFRFKSPVYSRVIHLANLTEKIMKSPEEIAVAIRDQFGSVFADFAYLDSKINFQVHDNISKVRLCNGLNFILGFEQVQFHRDVRFTNNILYQIGSYPPQMGRAINNIYVYASICKPIHVGGVMVPL